MRLEMGLSSIIFLVLFALIIYEIVSAFFDHNWIAIPLFSVDFIITAVLFKVLWNIEKIEGPHPYDGPGEGIGK
jgi:hypothetical protein